MKTQILLFIISFSTRCALQPIEFSKAMHQKICCQQIFPSIQKRNFIDITTIIEVVADPLFATKTLQLTLFGPFASAVFMKAYLNAIKKNPDAFAQSRKLEKAGRNFEQALFSIYHQIGHTESYPFEKIFFDKNMSSNHGGVQGSYLILPISVKKQLELLAQNIESARELGTELNELRGANLSEYQQTLKNLSFQQLRLTQEDSREKILALKTELEPLLSHEAKHILNKDIDARINLGIKTVVPATMLNTLTYNIPNNMFEGHSLIFGTACFLVLYAIPAHLMLKKIKNLNHNQELTADAYVKNKPLLINQFEKDRSNLIENEIKDEPTLTHPSFIKRIQNAEQLLEIEASDLKINKKC